MRTDDSKISTTPSLVAATAANTFVVQGLVDLDLNTASTNPRETLRRWLSIKSVLSTSLANNTQQQEDSIDITFQMFPSIGKGFCAEIFDEVSLGRVLKRAFTPHDNQLWNDFRQHTIVRRVVLPALESEPSFNLSVPQVYQYLTRDDEQWWSRNRSKWASGAMRESTDLLETEKILPLAKTIRDSLIAAYCPPNLRPLARDNRENKDCLIRVYLGRRSIGPLSTRNGFSLRNFEADLNILDDLRLEKESHAQAMAIALAAMHWDGKIDACDVEFVLGSARDQQFLNVEEIDRLAPRTSTSTLLDVKKSSVDLWLLDFNQCKGIAMDASGVEQAIAAFWQNDPYYPRPRPRGDPDRPLWEIFRSKYLEQSGKSSNVVALENKLPERFIEEIEREARRRALTGNGPPRAGPPRGEPRSVPPRENSSVGRRRGGQYGGGRGGFYDIPQLG
ncbi:hypothetical protein MMC19_000946 [Ptychographa xylographoides]|nr:hypothetical protein [Ptychographa xylographoides]